jgi:hypothetical protein
VRNDGSVGEQGRRRRRRAAAAVALSLAVACSAVMQAEPAAAANADGTIRVRVLTTTGPRSVFTGATPNVRVTAGTKAGRKERREVFFPAKAPHATDSESCATWRDAPGLFTQQGAAFRIVRVGTATRAITVTKNVYGPQARKWIFNVHVWDTAKRPEAFTLLGSVDLASLLAPSGEASLAPLPWHFCARLVGTKLSFVVWLPGQTRPAWSNPLHGGSMTIPPGWDQPGKTGWYIGHLDARQSARFTNIRTLKLR